MNNIYPNMMVIRSAKETVTKIGHIMKTNPTRICHVAYQEQLNKALAVVALEVNKEDTTYFKNYGTSWKLASFNVQLKPAMPIIIIRPNHVETSTLAIYALQSHAHIPQELII
eukprot:11718317-Ditylum_brightwellii.AAC.1